MKRYCFVSFAQPGHCDFGGMSYIRTAAALQKRGHDVQWILSPHPLANLNFRAQNIIKGFGLQFEEFSGLNSRNKDVAFYIKNFARHLKSNQYDCVVIDRVCVVAAFSAHLAGIPWATIGTDGRDWRPKSSQAMVNQGVFPGSWNSAPISQFTDFLYRDDFPKPSDKTMWASSPFLNISFFPKAYYQDTHDSEFPKHSHFVGCGTTPEPNSEQKYLLITFGNSFNPSVRHRLLKILKPTIPDLSINVLILAGNREVANAIHQIFRHNSAVDIKEWMPYDQAYRGAMGIIGHGGTSHVWYGLREGKPLLAVPLKADQFYGSFQLERLNVGRAVVPLILPERFFRLFGRFGGNMPGRQYVYLGKRKFSTKLHDLLTDITIRDSSVCLSRLMRAGGGIQASVSLLERLAHFREPISNCVTPSCCC